MVRMVRSLADRTFRLCPELYAYVGGVRGQDLHRLVVPAEAVAPGVPGLLRAFLRPSDLHRHLETHASSLRITKSGCSAVQTQRNEVISENLWTAKSPALTGRRSVAQAEEGAASC